MKTKLTERTIIRRQHDKNNPYFMMTRETAQNRDLSYEAIGMLAYLLSKPDDWKVIAADLRRDGCGRDKTMRILKELVQTGHLHRETGRDAKGHFVYGEYVISERPLTENPLTAEPFTDNPLTAEPFTDNPLLHSIELQRTEALITDQVNPEKQIIEKAEAEEHSAAAAKFIQESAFNHPVEKKNADEQNPPLPPNSAAPPSPNIGEIMQLWHENIAKLTPMVKDNVVDLVKDYGAEVVKFAVIEAVKYNKCSLAYIEAVCKRKAAGETPTDGRKYISGAFADMIQH